MEPFDRTIPATVHGRYLVRPARAGGQGGAPKADGGRPVPLVIGFHGYGQTGEDHLQDLERLPGSNSWHLVAVQGLHPFYTRTGQVVASWMTRLDRELAIADNVAYAASVADAVRRELRETGPLVFTGFSQGVAMAYRAAAAVPCDGLIVLAGDVPPDVDPTRLPPLLIGRGTEDDWYDEAKMTADLERLEAAGASAEQCVFEGGHVWGQEFREAAGVFLERVARRPSS